MSNDLSNDMVAEPLTFGWPNYYAHLMPRKKSPRVVRPSGRVRWNPAAIQEFAREQVAASDYEVEIRPGFATLRRRDREFSVSLEFAMTSAMLTRVIRLQDTKAVLNSIQRISLIRGTDLPETFDAVEAGVTLMWALLTDPISEKVNVPLGLPEIGRDLDLDWYRQLVSAKNRLEYLGDRTPAVTIAEEKRSEGYSEVTPDQVRVWVSRGKKYLKERGGT